MTTPNDDLEARLRATFDRAVARAGEDLAVTDLVSEPLAAGHRPRRWTTAGALAGVAAVLLIGVVLIVGAGGRRDPVEPPGTPGVGPVGSPTGSGGPDSGEGVPIIDPGVPFPATVDGRPVVSVGAAADAALAAATDSSPIYVSGWRIGTDPSSCADVSGSLDPKEVQWSDCAALVLRERVDGGATLLVHASLDGHRQYLRMSGRMAMEVLMQVHAHDPGCATPGCVQKPVFDAVVQYRTPRLAPSYLLASMPPGGITLDEAIAAADAYIARDSFGLPGPWTLLRAEVGPRPLVGSDREGDWAWAVWYVSADGYYEITVTVGYLDGQATEASGGNLLSP